MEIKSNPSLAIIIPVLNEAKVLPETFRVLHELSMGSTDSVVFVDGGSTDQSRTLIIDEGYTCLESATGRAKQMNVGTENTVSDIILYLHVDTSLTSSNISNIKKTYKQGFLSGRFDIRLSNSSLTYGIISFFINLRSRLTRISTGDQGIFVRRDILNQIGGIPEMPLMEDIALSRKLKRVGKIACLRHKLTTSSRRWETYGPARTILLMWRIRFFYLLGVSPKKLADMYRRSQ